MPGRLDQQPAYMAVAGLGDRALHARGARGVLALDSHAEVRATHRRNGLRWSAQFDLRCSLAPKDV
jgi:hypothetical protein